MFIKSVRMPAMSGCISVVTMAALAACGGAQPDGGVAMFTESAVVAADEVQFLATTAAIAAVVTTTTPPELAASAGGIDSALTLRIADSLRSSQVKPVLYESGGGTAKGPVVAATAPAPIVTAPPVGDVKVATATLQPAPAPATPPAGTSWSKVAAEGQTFALSGAAVVRFGAGGAWLSKTVNGTVSCTNAFFGSDPAVGIVKQCDLPTPSLALAAIPAVSLPTVDVNKLPLAAVGFSTPRLKAANVADSSQVANPSDIGAFREPCDFSHMSFDDPIVYPGQPGLAHLHTFFGNTGTNAYSTAASLAGSGNSTCAGGTLNRTAYWVPALIDTRTGTPIKPSGSIFYYKTGYNGIDARTVQALPAGLRMISGNAAGSQPSGPFNYGCVGLGNDYWAGQAIPKCAVGQDMLMSITFPQCWDGVNLDSPDHISHMSNPTAGRCPATHPVPVPVVAFQVHYTVKPGDDPGSWRLSSDSYDPRLPGGYSGHGDWFNGWDPATMHTFVQNCEQRSLDCRAYLLGNGQTLY